MPAREKELRRPVPRVALSQQEAAAALGVSVSHFERHIKVHLPVVYSGAWKLYPLSGLQRWLDAQALHRGKRVA